MKILIVDDHALLRDSLSLLLTARFGRVLELLHAPDGQSALHLVAKHAELSLILLDIDLPDIHGFQVLRQIRATCPGRRIIAVSGNDSPSVIRQCMSLGASGFIPKKSSGKTMLSAIEAVLNGERYTPPEASDAIYNETRAFGAAPTSLTERQIEVLKLIRKGLSNESIADVLSISLPTVKTHVRAIFEALQVKNRTEAVNEALLLNLI